MDKFLVSTSELQKTMGIGRFTLEKLRSQGKLVENIHFFKTPTGGIRLLWNVDLMRDFFTSGGGATHQKAVDKFLKSMASHRK